MTGVLGKIFAVCLFAAALGCFGSELERARDFRDSAIEEYASFERERSVADAKHAETLEELRRKLKELQVELEREKSELEFAESAGRRSGLQRAELANIAQTTADLAEIFGFTAGFVGPLKTAVADAKSVVERAENLLLRPDMSMLDGEVEDKSGKKIPGKIFRVGAFKYFCGDSVAGLVSDDLRLYGETFAQAIRNFLGGSSKTLPVDLSGGNFMRGQFGNRGFLEDVAAGGVWMYPILFFGVLSLFVCAVKIPSVLRVGKLDGNDLKMVFAALKGGEDSKALEICKKIKRPYGIMLARLVSARNLGTSALEEISYECMLEAGGKLFGGLSVLSVSAAVAPLFGLLGTVTGIIKTFGDLSFNGAQQAQLISAGISEALITTEYGLIVAIPALVAHAVLSRSAKSVMSEMEKAASACIGEKL